MKKLLLMILDGWGIAKDPSVSAINMAHTPFIDLCYEKYPHSQLLASGLAVGLPEGQMGNSEVGHINLGAGRVVYQNLFRINMAVDDGSLARNKELDDALGHALEHRKKVHFIGLLSDGGVHSHIRHLFGLLDAAAAKGLKEVFVHAFTDGRDTDPKSGKNHLKDLLDHLNRTTGELATVIGRYYAIDRDQRWSRVKKAYDVMTHGLGNQTRDVLYSVQSSYDQGITDEFMEPIVMLGPDQKPLAKIESGDVVICFNFRTDRGRQITEMLTQKGFSEYGINSLDLYYVTMTSYDRNFQNIHVLFEEDNLENTLGEILERQGKKQLRIAETEKYPHVTFFFSGGREKPFRGERRIMFPSPKVATYDLKPEMKAQDIRDNVIPELQKKEADFICLNFSNPDMVGHTGVMAAAVMACETVDKFAQEVCKVALENDYAVLILSDHGNADCMINPDGTPNTAHTTQPVPCFLLERAQRFYLKDGKLGDIAPTILELMSIPQPEAMTGVSLLSK
ncbi:MAG: 2,3-bisphosphoglycerate-independent phosphoglycerate mutase [Flavobacteriales bacterium Tduv]